MERSTVFVCTIPCHLVQEGRVGGHLAVYFLLSLAVPSYNCSNRINESINELGTGQQLTEGL